MTKQTKLQGTKLPPAASLFSNASSLACSGRGGGGTGRGSPRGRVCGQQEAGREGGRGGPGREGDGLRLHGGSFQNKSMWGVAGPGLPHGRAPGEAGGDAQVWKGGEATPPASINTSRLLLAPGGATFFSGCRHPQAEWVENETMEDICVMV